MKAEREIAGFALPFTVGIVTASALLWPDHHVNTMPYAIVNTIIFIPLLLLLHPVHNRMSGHSVQLLIISAAFICGMVTGTTGKILSISGGTGPGPVMELAHHMCTRLKEAIECLPFSNRETNSLLVALLTGDRSGIPQRMSETFRESGASHILALSGMHLGIIYGITDRIFSMAGNNISMKRIRSVGVMTVCAAYTILTGAGPSIVRAMIFILAGESARMMGRYRSTESILYTALVMQLSLFPSDIKSVSFQLSYAAMAGITFINPWLRSMWPERSKGMMGFIWNSAALSISCQLTTGPLVWLYFKSLPQYFILTNLIAVPLTGMIIPCAILNMILSALGICPDIMTRATEGLVQTLTVALDIISSM